MRRAAAPFAVVLAACGGGGEGAPLRAEPSRLDFGPTPVEGLRSASLVLVNETGDAQLVQRFAPESTLVGVFEPIGAPRVIPEGETEVRVDFRPIRVGRWLGDLRLELDSAAGLPALVIPVSGTGVAGELVARPDAVDFGRVRLGRSVTATVALENAGAGPIDVEVLTFDPGSSPAIEGRLARRGRLEPGETTAAHLRFTPLTRAPVEAVARVATATREGSGLAIPIQGEGATSSLGVEPATGLRFEGVLVGEVVRRMVRVRSLSTARLEVRVAIVGEGPGLSVDPPGPFSLAPGDERDLEVGFAPEAPGSIEAGLGFFEPTGDVVEVPIRAEARVRSEPRARLPGPPLDFGRVTLGHRPTRSAWLFVEGERGLADGLPSRIVPGDGPFLLLVDPTPTRPRARRRLEIELRPVVAGPLAATLEVGTATRSLRGEAGPDPAAGLEAWPPVVDFGRVPRGEVGRRRVWLRSIGTAPVEGLEARLAPPFTLAGPAPMSIPAGEARALALELDVPDVVEGAWTGSLWVRAEEGIDVEVAVVGRVVPPSLDEPDVEVRVAWATGAALDLHLVRADDPTFGVPGDACFCNPQPDWGEPEVPMDDPRLVVDVGPGPGEERIRIDRASEPFFRVEVVETEGPPTDAEVEIWVRGRPIGRWTRRLGPRTRWIAGTLRLVGLGVTFDAADLPLEAEDRWTCD